MLLARASLSMLPGIRLHELMLSQLGLPATPISEITTAGNGRKRTCRGRAGD